MAERVHYRSLWILSGLCKNIWHVSTVELQFSKPAISLPLLQFQQKPWQPELCLLQMLQENNEGEVQTRIRMRDKSVALRGTWIGLIAETLFFWVYSIYINKKEKDLLLSWDNKSSLRALGWGDHVAEDCCWDEETCEHSSLNWQRSVTRQPDRSSSLPLKSTHHCHPETPCCLHNVFNTQPI